MNDTIQCIQYRKYGLLYVKCGGFVKPEKLQNERNYLQTLMESSLIL